VSDDVGNTSGERQRAECLGGIKRNAGKYSWHLVTSVQNAINQLAGGGTHLLGTMMTHPIQCRDHGHGGVGESVKLKDARAGEERKSGASPRVPSRNKSSGQVKEKTLIGKPQRGERSMGEGRSQKEIWIRGVAYV